jgi:hypothetical protein
MLMQLAKAGDTAKGIVELLSAAEHRLAVASRMLSLTRTLRRAAR